MHNRMTEDEMARQDAHAVGCTSLDHCRALDALHQLRLVAERELMRLSWLMGMPLIPPATYKTITRRVLADALDAIWGDYDAAKAALSPELYAELLRIIADNPMSDLDWAMRIFAICESAPRPEASGG